MVQICTIQTPSLNMEQYIPISFLNDFIFCPRSIYFHQLYKIRKSITFQENTQIEGKIAHQSIDNKRYSSRKSILQGIAVYSEHYKLHGKIDILDVKRKLLIERKKLIKTIYDGYIFQIYAQYHCLTEMGYEVEVLNLYSMDTNKSYQIPLPKEDSSAQISFEKLIGKINRFNLNDSFEANPKKCIRCIYSEICDKKAEAC